MAAFRELCANGGQSIIAYSTRVSQLDLQNQISRLLYVLPAKNTQMSYIIDVNVFQKFRSGMGYPLLWPQQLNHVVHFNTY